MEESFTLEDVEKLIDEVQRATTLEGGSQPGWRQEGSHMKGEFVAQKAEGSVQQDSHKEEESDAKKDKGSKFQEEDSQFESERVQNRIRAHVASLGDECTVGDLGCLVTDVLHILEPISQACRPGSTTRKYDIFPLPVPGHGLPGFNDHPFLQALVGCLNSLHSCGEAGRGDVVSPAAQ